MIRALILASLCAASPELLSPLEQDHGLASSFGELRGDRVHMGIDYRTPDLEMPVRAVAAGQVVRIKEQWRGYGLAVYIQHDDGTVSVYAHLARVADDLERELARVRKARESRWAGDVTPATRKVARGEVFAWSGESGAGLPHLHLEIRQGMDQALDPFTVGLPQPSDPDPPVAERLVIAPAGVGATVDGSPRTQVYRLERDGADFKLAKAPRIHGAVDLLLEAHDTVGAANHAGLGGFRTLLNDKERWRVGFGAIPYAQSRTSGALLDLGRSHLSPTLYFYRVNGLAGANLPYARGEPGPLALAPGRHAIEIELRDAVTTIAPRTRVRLQLEVFDSKETTMVNPADASTGAPGIDLIPLGTALRIIATPGEGKPARRAQFDTEEIELTPTADGNFTDLAAPRNGAFAVAVDGKRALAAVATITPDRDAMLSLGMATVSLQNGVAWAPALLVARLVARPLPAGLVPLASMIEITPDGHPLRKSATISFARKAGRGAAVYQYDPVDQDFDLIDLGTSAEVDQMGVFALLDDQSPPVIDRISPADGAKTKRTSFHEISVGVDDLGTGIPENGVSIALDGKSLDLLYDPDRDRARAQITPAVGTHLMTIQVSDRAGNVAERQTTFVVE